MKLVILHLSNIHLSTERWPDNPILKRGPSIIAAVRSLFLKPEEVAASLLIVTGDVAFAGLKSEYDLAKPFFHEIEEGLIVSYPRAQHRKLLVPGNHDCNFNDDDQARCKLIDEPNPSSLADGSIVTAVTAVQNNFFEFCREINDEERTATGLNRLYCAQSVDIGEKSVLIRMLNSAWASQKNECRQMMLPVSYLNDQFRTDVTPTVAITALHHPYNWFEPNNARVLRKLLEESADVILTGHEHCADMHTKMRLTGEQNEYIEGGVLQELGEPSSGSFNVVVIDLQAEMQELHHFVWNGELYECANEVVPRPFIRNKFRLKGEFALNQQFEEVLNDPDATFTHPYKDKITLDDVFIYPDFFELDEKHAKTTARVVNGHDPMPLRFFGSVGSKPLKSPEKRT